MKLPKPIAKFFKKDPYTDPTSIGNLAIKHGYLTKDQLSNLLDLRVNEILLGEHLVSCGILTSPQRDDLVREQLDLRRARPYHRAMFELSVQKESVEEFNKKLQETNELAKKLGFMKEK